MNTARLINQLLQIEQSLGKIEPARIRGMLFEAQESVLAIEKEMIEVLTDYEGLKMLMEFSRNSWDTVVPAAETPSKFLVN